MSLSDVGLRKKFRDIFMPEQNYSIEDLNKKSARCIELFDTLHDCVLKHGWNDN